VHFNIPQYHGYQKTGIAKNGYFGEEAQMVRFKGLTFKWFNGLGHWSFIIGSLVIG